MLSRREFIGSLLAAGAALSHVDTSASDNRKVRSLGFISGMIKSDIERDWKSALRQAAALGYTELEISDCPSKSVAEFLSFCSDINLKPVGGGIAMSTDRTTFEARLDMLVEMKMEYAVAYWPWFVSAPFKRDDCKTSAEALNLMGEAAKKRNMSLLWHNHDHEFTPMEDGLPFDYLMTHTDKDLVHCEMDVYWITKGGADPSEMLQKYKNRYKALHIKDMAPTPSDDFACAGEGRIDFASIFNEADRQGIRHFFVERDNVVDGMECLRVSYEHLRKLR